MLMTILPKGVCDIIFVTLGLVWSQQGSSNGVLLPKRTQLVKSNELALFKFSN